MYSTDSHILDRRGQHPVVNRYNL